MGMNVSETAAAAVTFVCGYHCTVKSLVITAVITIHIDEEMMKKLLSLTW